MNEEWKPIKGLEGLYEVSNLGKIKSVRSNKVMAPRMTPTGYERVTLPTNEGRRDFYIHRLVAEVFCTKPDGCNVVNHLDNNTRNNRADNLEWTTQRGNVIHAMNQGRVKRFPNAMMVIGIKDGVEHLFRSSHEAAQETGCDHKTVLYGCRTGKQSQNGFLWKVVNAS